MPHDDPDPTDPMTLHDVLFETEDDAAIREMASCFVEEYLRLGFDPDLILKMFKTKGYAGPYMAYQTLGEQAIRSIVDEQASVRGWTAESQRCCADQNLRR